MILTQVTLLVKETIKKPNGAESTIETPYLLPAKKRADISVKAR